MLSSQWPNVTPGLGTIHTYAQQGVQRRMIQKREDKTSRQSKGHCRLIVSYNLAKCSKFAEGLWVHERILTCHGKVHTSTVCSRFIRTHNGVGQA